VEGLRSRWYGAPTGRINLYTRQRARREARKQSTPILEFTKEWKARERCDLGRSAREMLMGHKLLLVPPNVRLLCSSSGANHRLNVALTLN